MFQEVRENKVMNLHSTTIIKITFTLLYKLPSKDLQKALQFLKSEHKKIYKSIAFLGTGTKFRWKCLQPSNKILLVKIVTHYKLALGERERQMLHRTCGWFDEHSEASKRPPLKTCLMQWWLDQHRSRHLITVTSRTSLGASKISCTERSIREWGLIRKHPLEADQRKGPILLLRKAIVQG